MLLTYGVSTDETKTRTPNILIVRGTTDDISASVETTSSPDNTIVFDGTTDGTTISSAMTNTLSSTYFISTSVTVAISKESLDSATIVDTGTAVTFSSDVMSTAAFEAFPGFTGTAGPKADTAPSRSLGLETGDTVPTPLATTTACVTCYNTFTSSATAAASSDSTDIANSGTYTTNEIISTTRLNDATATSTGAPPTGAIPELIPRSDAPPCNVAADCSFTAGNERIFPSDIPMKTLPPDVSVTPGLVSVSLPDVALEVPYPNIPLPDITCRDVPLTVPMPNISPPDEGQLNIPLPDVPLFNEIPPNELLPNVPPPNSPLPTLSPAQSPLYITCPNVPLPDKPLPAVPPKELRYDDPSAGVSLVDVLTSDIPSPAVPRPDLPLLDTPPEVPRLDEIPRDTLPTYLSPVDILTSDVATTKVPLVDIVPGTPSSKSPDNLSEPPLDAVPADVSVESLLSSSEQGGSNAVPDKTTDQPNGSDLAPMEFTFPFLEDPKSDNSVLGSVPVLDDLQNVPDESSASADNLRLNPLDSIQNSVLEQPNTNEKVNEETGSIELVSSTQSSASKSYKPDLTQGVESLVALIEEQSSTVVPIRESDQNNGTKDKNTEEQNWEKGTK